MSEAPKPAKVVHLADKHRPANTVKTACPSCGREATRAVYQHNCNPAVVTWEIPAYSAKKDPAPVKWSCPLCKAECDAVLIKCGDCRRIAKVRQP